VKDKASPTSKETLAYIKRQAQIKQTLSAQFNNDLLLSTNPPEQKDSDGMP